MREQFKTIFENLPPYGIAVHGTSLRRATAIQSEGLNPAKSSGKEGFGKHVFYAVQPPECPNPKATIKNLTGKVSGTAVNKAISASIKTANIDNDEPALVIFFPIEIPPKILSSAGIPFISYESNKIPPENIIGVVNNPEKKLKMDKEFLKTFIKLLNEKGILNSDK